MLFLQPRAHICFSMSAPTASWCLCALCRQCCPKRKPQVHPWITSFLYPHPIPSQPVSHQTTSILTPEVFLFGNYYLLSVSPHFLTGWFPAPICLTWVSHHAYLLPTQHCYFSNIKYSPLHFKFLVIYILTFLTAKYTLWSKTWWNR